MPEKFTNEYTPECASHPGETLLEMLEDRSMAQSELAERMGRPKKTINEIINGKSEITPETAIQLERVLGVPASFWNNLERHYRDSLARKEERGRLKQHIDWPKQFPLRQMATLRWLGLAADPVDQVRSLLSFFGVSSVDQWQQRYQEQLAAYRLPQKFAPDLFALTAWLREGERRAQSIQCLPFEADLFRKALHKARQLTTESHADVFVRRLREIGSECGVAILFVPELKASRACGATRWLNPQKALIQLSLRYKSNDQLWFTFFHEAGHLILHGKREAFVEVWGGGSGSKVREDEANRFSADHLIPPSDLERLLEQGPLSGQSIVAFAEEIGIAPGIVVGRLQHDKHIPYKYLNALKVRYRWEHEAE